MDEVNESRVEKVREYLAGLMDDRGVIHLDNLAEKLLVDALVVIDELKVKADQADKVYKLASGMWEDESIFAGEIQEIFK